MEENGRRLKLMWVQEQVHKQGRMLKNILKKWLKMGRVLQALKTWLIWT
jgi:hypothetical protein